MGYGTVRAWNAHVKSNLCVNNLTVHQKICEHIGSHDNSFDTYEEGFRKVRQGSFALLMSTNLIKYTNAHAPCDTLNVGSPLFTFSFSMGVANGSPLREPISAILGELEEDAMLGKLAAKWFGGG